MPDMAGFMFSATQKSKLWLDPRTKLVMLIVTNIIIISGGISGIAGILRSALMLLPFLLLLIEGKKKTALIYFIFLCPAMLTEHFFLGSTSGVLNLILLIYSGVIARFIPGIMMGYYFITTTKISELIAAMERMHIPQSIIIPFAVMIRFFPTVGEENSSISMAMRMRGVRIGGGNAVSMLEYRFVPMLMTTVKIGEELSAAALTRGLGAPVKRTNMCRVGFRVVDSILVIIMITILCLWIFL